MKTFKDYIMNEASLVTIGSVLDPDIISYDKGVGEDILLKVKNPISSIEYINKDYKDSDGVAYVRVDFKNFNKIKDFMVTHVTIGAHIVCESIVSLEDIARHVTLNKKDFFVSKDGTHFKQTN